MDNSTTVDVKIPEGFIGQRAVLVSEEKRKVISRNALSGQLYATAIGYYPLASHHDRERVAGSGEHILIYCVDGKGWVELNGLRHNIEQNMFYIIPPKTPHHYGSSAREPWSIYWVHFKGNQAPLLYERYTQLPAQNGLHIAYAEERLTQFNCLMDLLEADPGTMAIEQAYIKLLGLLGSFIYPDSSTHNTETDAITQSVNFMKQQVKGTYPISHFAALANYSVSRYSELFRQRTGYAPMQYFIHLKVHKACQYLCFTKMNIKQICNEVGFDDPYYFSRIFKKTVGHSPLEYRKMNKL